MADKIKTICRVNSEIKRGEGPSHVFLRECNVTREEAGVWGERWAMDGFEKNPKYFNLDMWAKFVRQRSPALRQLSLAQVKEKILQRVAHKLGVEQNKVPKNFVFVWVDPGTKVVANVIRGAKGMVMIENVSDEAMARAKRDHKNILDSMTVGQPTAGCFTGSTVLQLEDGRLVTFEQLAGWSVGQSLPKVACFNPETSKIIYQQPLAVLEHHFVEAEPLSPIYLEGGDKQPLEVTANHPLLVERAGKFLDIAVGALNQGDTLVNPKGGILKLGRGKKTRGVLDLYNLSLTTQENQTLSPYYLVSANGIQWVVAHNIKILI